MSIFIGDGLAAWRRWHQLICDRFGVGTPDAGDVVQPLSIAAPARFDSVHSPLERYLQNTYAERLPQWLPLPNGPFKDQLYIPSGARLSTGYKLFLKSIKSSFDALQTPAQRLAIEQASQAAESARELLERFETNTLGFWELWKARHPEAERAVWERDNHIAEKRRPLKADRDMSLAAYLRCLADAGAGEAELLAEQQMAMDDPTQQYRLPATPAQWGELPDSWDRFYRQEFSNDFVAFRDTPGVAETLDIKESSVASHYLETRWNVSASVSFLGLFRAGGLDANGRDIEEHMRSDTTSVQVGFDKLEEFIITRGAWYDEQIIRRYMGKVPAEVFWGPNGVLNLIPRSVIVVRGMHLTMTCSAETLDRVEHHLGGSADAGIWCGWFKIGGGGGGGRDEVTITRHNDSNTLTLSPKDPKACQVLAIRSWRPLDLLGQQITLDPAHKLAQMAFLREQEATSLLSSVRARILGDQHSAEADALAAK